MLQTLAVACLSILPPAPGSPDTRGDPHASRLRKAPAVLLLGKWAGLITIGKDEHEFTFEFHRGGQGVLSVADSHFHFTYRVLPGAKLEFTWRDRVGAMPA